MKPIALMLLRVKRRKKKKNLGNCFPRARDGSVLRPQGVRNKPRLIGGKKKKRGSRFCPTSSVTGRSDLVTDSGSDLGFCEDYIQILWTSQDPDTCEPTFRSSRRSGRLLQTFKIIGAGVKLRGRQHWPRSLLKLLLFVLNVHQNHPTPGVLLLVDDDHVLKHNRKRKRRKTRSWNCFHFLSL